MAKTINVSFREEDEHLYDWVEKMVEDGPYASKSHLMRRAVTRMREEHGTEYVI